MPTPVGFQYISSLMSSPCASSVDKFSPNPYWLDNYVSPTAAKLSSVNNLTAASQKRVFQKAVHKVREATSDLFYDGLLWKGAGAPVFFSPQPGLSRAPGLDASFYYNDSFSYTPDFVEAVSVAHPSEFFEAQVLTGVNFSARFFDALLLPFSYDGPLQMEREGGGPADAQQAVQLARDAAAKGANVVTGFEIPLCSFPDTRSPTVESTPSTSGLGFLAALPASFNCAFHIVLVTLPPPLSRMVWLLRRFFAHQEAQRPSDAPLLLCALVPCAVGRAGGAGRQGKRV